MSAIDRYPLTIDGCAELAVVERGGFDESRHYGAAVVVDHQGAAIRAVGDSGASIYPRSTLKLFQALAVRRVGAVFEDEELVLSAASHAGSARHQLGVERMLAAHGFVGPDLGCPQALPHDPETAKHANGPTRIAMECSGKHAAMLSTCRVNGWDPATYLDVEHPVQQTIVATVEDLSGERIDRSGVDGCGAPIFPMTLHSLAVGVSRIVTSTDADSRALVDAIVAHPWAIDGEGRPNATVIGQLKIIAKTGADGVMVMGVPGRGAVAVKALDGSPRATSLAALSLLANCELIPVDAAQRAAASVVPEVLGGGNVVGRIRPGKLVSWMSTT